MSMPEEGKKAPAFQLKDQHGKSISLSDFKGQHVVLYFYPKDSTPGCTSEACDFRDFSAQFKKLKTVVLGVSPDSQISHEKFAKKYELPFSLLVDADHQVAEKYGAFGEKSMYGKKYMGIIRSTFLIGPEGKILKVWPKVKVTGHVKEVLESIQKS